MGRHRNNICPSRHVTLETGTVKFIKFFRNSKCLIRHLSNYLLVKYLSIMCSILCLGPTGAGKTLLIKKLQNKESVDETSCTISTTGSNLSVLRFPDKKTGTIKEHVIRELGGAMAPIWHKYYEGVNKIIYVVDASNLCQIAAAGILLFTTLADPQLRNAKLLIVLTKMDVSYRQMRNEALLMLQMKRMEKEVPQSVTILESSAVSGEGVENIGQWIQGKLPKNVELLLK